MGQTNRPPFVFLVVCLLVFQDYLSAVLEYLEEKPTRTQAHGIKGIWVAADNVTAVEEVRAVANTYFPNVLIENIVYVAGGVPGGAQISEVPTMSYTQVQCCGVLLTPTRDC